MSDNEKVHNRIQAYAIEVTVDSHDGKVINGPWRHINDTPLDLPPLADGWYWQIEYERCDCDDE